MSMVGHISDELSELSLEELRTVEKDVKHYITIKQEEFLLHGGTHP